MARVIKFAQTIRNNWKKSVFAAVVVAYGTNYAKNSYEYNITYKPGISISKAKSSNIAERQT